MATPNALERASIQRGLGGGSFADQLVRWADKVEARQKAIFDGVVEVMRDSIVNGSSLTGAPGQPVDTGELHDSWVVRYESPNVATITTDKPYARAIEHNWKRVRKSLQRAWKKANPNLRLTKARLKGLRATLGLGLRFRSGGAHSVALTRVAFRRVVEHVARQVVGAS